MNKILIVIPFHKGDILRAGLLLDWIYRLNGKKAIGSVLLAAAGDVHKEDIEKLKVSAEMAFEDCSAVTVNTKSKDAMIPLIAPHIEITYRLPWFLCEPDMTPISPDWISIITDSYFAQPRRYCGSQMRAGTTLFPCKCIMYPNDASKEFGINTSQTITDKMTKTRLVREFPIVLPADCDNVDAGVVAVHPDKSGIAISYFEEKLSKKKVSKRS